VTETAIAEEEGATEEAGTVAEEEAGTVAAGTVGVAAETAAAGVAAAGTEVIKRARRKKEVKMFSAFLLRCFTNGSRSALVTC
jgi:hypothetical protein